MRETTRHVFFRLRLDEQDNQKRRRDDDEERRRDDAQNVDVGERDLLDGVLRRERRRRGDDRDRRRSLTDRLRNLRRVERRL